MEINVHNQLLTSISNCFWEVLYETMMEVSESLINMFAYKELGGARYGQFPIEVEYNGVTAEDYFKGLYHAVSAT